MQEERLAALLAEAKAAAAALLVAGGTAALPVGSGGGGGDRSSVGPGSVVSGAPDGSSVGAPSANGSRLTSRRSSRPGSVDPGAGGMRRGSNATALQAVKGPSVPKTPTGAAGGRRSSVSSTGSGGGSVNSSASRAMSASRRRGRRGSRSSVRSGASSEDERPEPLDSDSDDDGSTTVMSVMEQQTKASHLHNKAVARAQRSLGVKGPLIPLAELELEPSKVLPGPPPPPPPPPPASDSDTTLSSDWEDSSSPEPSEGDDAIVAAVAVRVDVLRRQPELSVKEVEELEEMLHLNPREARAIKRHHEIAAFRVERERQRRLHDMRVRERTKRRKRKAARLIAARGNGGGREWDIGESSKPSTMLYRYRGSSFAVDVLRKQPAGKQEGVFCRMDSGVWEQGTGKGTMRIRGSHLHHWAREQVRAPRLVVFFALLVWRGWHNFFVFLNNAWLGCPRCAGFHPRRSAWSLVKTRKLVDCMCCGQCSEPWLLSGFLGLNSLWTGLLPSSA
jgi:hypothetical protein